MSRHQLLVIKKMLMKVLYPSITGYLLVLDFLRKRGPPQARKFFFRGALVSVPWCQFMILWHEKDSTLSRACSAEPPNSKGIRLMECLILRFSITFTLFMSQTVSEGHTAPVLPQGSFVI